MAGFDQCLYLFHNYLFHSVLLRTKFSNHPKWAVQFDYNYVLVF